MPLPHVRVVEVPADTITDSNRYKLEAHETTILVLLSLSGSYHWVLLYVDAVRRRTILYDSVLIVDIPDGRLRAAMMAVTKVHAFSCKKQNFNIDQKALQQHGVIDYGTYDVVLALYLAVRRIIPTQIDPLLWRILFRSDVPLQLSFLGIRTKFQTQLSPTPSIDNLGAMFRKIHRVQADAKEISTTVDLLELQLCNGHASHHSR